MDMFGIVFLICLIVFFLLALLAMAVGISITKKEQKAYEKMIIYPSDLTVSEYIYTFTYYHNNFLARGMSKSNVTLNRIRQAQGYSEIVKSSEVSEEMKNRLKIILSAKGVPVEI